MKSCCRKPAKDHNSINGSEYSEMSEDASQPYDTEADEQEEEMSLGRQIRGECDRMINLNQSDVPYLWYPSLQNVKQIDYVRRLERDYEGIQTAFFTLTTHFARLQFRLRQIMTAPPNERDALFKDLEKVAFGSLDDCQVSDEMPHIQHDHRAMGDVRRKQALICETLRSQLTALSEASEIEGMEIVDGPMPCESNKYYANAAGAEYYDYDGEMDEDDKNDDQSSMQQNEAGAEDTNDNGSDDISYTERSKTKERKVRTTVPGDILAGESDVEIRRQKNRN